jgi:hypothetical protein
MSMHSEVGSADCTGLACARNSIANRRIAKATKELTCYPGPDYSKSYGYYYMMFDEPPS